MRGRRPRSPWRWRWAPSPRRWSTRAGRWWASTRPSSPRGGGSDGIGFAIPANLAKTVLTQLADGGHVERGWLGVSIQPGDVIVEVDRKPVGNAAELRERLAQRKGGSPIVLLVKREQASLYIAVPIV